MRPTVLELLISTKYDVDRIDRINVKAIDKALNRNIYPAKHTSHSVSLFVVTRETAQQLVDRIGPTLEAIYGIADWRVNSVGRDAAARHGDNDPIAKRLALAWREADRRGNYTKSEDLSSTQPGDIFAEHGIEQLDRKAAVKMGLRPRREREAAADADQPQGDATHDVETLRKQAEALFSPKIVTSTLSDE
jgi:hypothetical protein